ncbi:MAG: YcaQ family DNA glycosylase [Bacteroidetes bacterium]|nr:YcaQ family DNA glycosylase [Bacteroidota bacterium]
MFVLKADVNALRNSALDAQGLGDHESGKGKTGTLNTIRHLGYVQLDTLSVVARAHHHVLWSRVKDHREEFLHELMKEKKIFEYWSHAAAFLPMEDFRFSLLRKNDFRKGKKHWFAKNNKMHRFVTDKIKAEGALQARDFETDKTRGSWFDWKPAKIALEQLFQDGTLMVKERKGFQKVYDLTERILPSCIDTTLPSKEEFANYLITSCLRAHGFASLKDITHLQAAMRTSVEKELKKLLKEGTIEEINIPGSTGKYFAKRDFIQNSKLKIENRQLAILSPFDNLVIRRDRLKKIFNYDFAIECYLPEHKRKFGYFCLPVLYGNEFVARFDPKVDREKKIFYVKEFHLEKKMNKKEKKEFMEKFEVALEEFSLFNGCRKIVGW